MGQKPWRNILYVPINFSDDIYKPLESVEGWQKCSHCGRYPKVWIFDYGNYAKCNCRHAFGPSINETMCHEKKSYDEYKELLRLAWNRSCNEILLKKWHVFCLENTILRKLV